ncbi:glycoside hydrolase family 3 N-terminal domain-containing protein [Pseudalkalibacillus sp. SCS-8]|uniref:glycoside hydrolase family 3 N-terminal domain-containing protein n=1 Tax=Pseudalkalibacillus nanhaiensis TaxID=3115291 RepID=UPI0039C97817
MERLNKRLLIPILVLLLVVSQLMFGQPFSAAAKGKEAVKDLILYENVPQATEQITNDTIQLEALHVYNEGHFAYTSQGLEWKSSNEEVAHVYEDGTVHLTGKEGQSVIFVSDGTRKDHIKVGYKKGEAYVKKQTGKRYDILKHAISQMTIKEKLGQMLMPDFRKWNGEDVTEMKPEILRLIDEYHLGGVILFRENVVTTEQTTKLVHEYQQATDKFAPLLTIDQEGGIVTRLQSGTDMPGNMALGATRSPVLAKDVGRVIGEEIDALGINMNLAPVLDVNNNPDNPVIGVRSFGEDPKLVSELGVSYINGLQEAGVAATAKHFPGHGDTAVDSHLGLPEVPHDKERLKQVELYPFQKAMDAGIDAVMTAHVTFPKIDDTKVTSKKDGTEVTLPATLSHKVLTGLMREEMGFDGVIITDAMNMGAIKDHFGTVDAAILAVKAGTDIVLMPVGLEDVAAGLLDAIEKGEITEERLDQSVERILTLKFQRGIIKKEQPLTLEEKVARAMEIVGSEAHKEVERQAAEQSITLLKNDEALPVDTDEGDEVVVVGRSFIQSLGEAISQMHHNTTVIHAPSNYELTEEQLEKIKGAEHVIVGTYSYSVWTRSPEHPQMKMVQKIMEITEGDVVGIGIRNPYDFMAYPEVEAYIAQYGFRTASFEATAKTLFGMNKPVGKLPVTIPGQDGGILYEYGHGLTFESE